MVTGRPRFSIFNKRIQVQFNFWRQPRNDSITQCVSTKFDSNESKGLRRIHERNLYCAMHSRTKLNSFYKKVKRFHFVPIIKEPITNAANTKRVRQFVASAVSLNSRNLSYYCKACGKYEERLLQLALARNFYSEINL